MKEENSKIGRNGFLPTKQTSVLVTERGRGFLWWPVFFGLGIGIYFLLPAEPSPVVIGTLLPVLTLLLFLFRRRPVVRGALWLLWLAAAGFADMELQTFLLMPEEPTKAERKLYISGRIDVIDTNYNGRQRILLSSMKDFDDNPLPGRYRLTLIHRNNNLNAGDCVELIGVVSPLFKPSVAGGYQSDRNLYFAGINGSGYIPSEVLKLDCPAGGRRFGDRVAKLRDDIARRIHRVLPPDEASVAVALIAGDQTGISRRLIEAYRDSGLAHFLSISGVHMSMLAGLMFFLVRAGMALAAPLALRFNSKKTAAYLSILVSAAYLLLSGMPVPAVRAFLMTLVVLLAVLFEREAVSVRTLALSALIVLIIEPAALVGASFQMSYAAVIALVAFYEKFAGRLNRFLTAADVSLPRRIMRGLAVYLIGVLAADLVASLATLPFAVFHFNRVALCTSLTNLLSGPVIAFIIMPFVLVSLLAFPFGLEFVPLKIVGFGLEIVNNLTLWVASLPYAATSVLSMPLWGLLLIVAGGLWLCLLRSRLRLWGAAAIVLGALSLLGVKRPEVIVDAEIKTVAVLNSQSNSYYFLSRPDRWNKQNWLSKFAAAETKDKPQNSLWPARIKIKQGKSIFVDGREFDVRSAGGTAFYDNNGKITAKTVRAYIGRRPWNM